MPELIGKLGCLLVIALFVVAYHILGPYTLGALIILPTIFFQFLKEEG